MITTQADYIKALKSHDWDYQYSDDSRVYRRGRDERVVIEAAQKSMDADFAVWNANCPAHYRRDLVVA